MEEASSPEHKRLEALIGRWKTDGSTREMPGAPVTIDAVDAYEWLPGGFALLHTVDAKMGEEKVEGAEIIGFDPERGAYSTLYFGSDGATEYEADLTRGTDGLTWRMRSKDDPVHRRFQQGRQRDHGSLGALARQSRLATLDGHHAD